MEEESFLDTKKISARIIINAILIITLVILVLIVFLYLMFFYGIISYTNKYNSVSSSQCDEFVFNNKGIIKFPDNKYLYDRDLAESLMNLCENVSHIYCVSIDNAPIPIGFKKDPIPLMIDNTIYGVIYSNDNNEYLIVFIGTESMKEWRYDFEVSQVNPTELNGYQDGMLVHKGFYEIYSQIRNNIKIPSKAKIFITGHSLGGGLSTLCTFDLQSIKNNNYNIYHYNFASPRVGNKMFVDRFNKIAHYTIRINNTEDIIPQTPPAYFLDYQYEHVGQNFVFTSMLDSLDDNHVKAYLTLPKCSEVARCELLLDELDLI